MDGFLQDPPRLGNQFSDDEFLVSQLARLLPDASMQQDLGEEMPTLHLAAASNLISPLRR